MQPTRAVRCGAVARAAWARALSTSATTHVSQYSVTIPDVSLAQYLFADAKIAPIANRVAVIDSSSGTSVTYAELRERIAYAALELRARGIGKGDVVNLHAPNSTEFLVAFQAIAAIGAISTTSNPLYTSSELHHQLKTARAKAAITIAPLAPAVEAAAQLAGIDAKQVFVIGRDSGSFLTRVGSSFTALEPVEVNPAKDLLTLPFSSGTTGLPKGVMLSHRNVVANVEQCCHPRLNVDLLPGDVVLGLLPGFHIYGMTVVMASALKQGATVVTVPRFDPMGFLTVLARHRVTYAPLVPPIINFLARHPAVEGFDLSSLRTIFSGAAPLDAETQRLTQTRLSAMKAARLGAGAPGVSVRQGYGMTELSPVSHVADPHVGLVPGSIGLPVAETECRILDQTTGEPLPAGRDRVGELCVRGPQVMQGYLDNPAATAAALSPDGWLRTGDLVARDESGNYFVVDRVKELIKCKGFQVAPAELEGILLQHAAVADAAVVGRADERSGEVPVAFVVTKRSAHPELAGELPEVTAGALMEHVEGRVAEYKRLAEVRFVKAIPKSASGKILRRELKAQLVAAAAGTGSKPPGA